MLCYHKKTLSNKGADLTNIATHEKEGTDFEWQTKVCCYWCTTNTTKMLHVLIHSGLKQTRWNKKSLTFNKNASKFWRTLIYTENILKASKVSWIKLVVAAVCFLHPFKCH